MGKAILLHRANDNGLIGVPIDRIVCILTLAKSTTIWTSDGYDAISQNINEKATDILKRLNGERRFILVHTDNELLLPVDEIESVEEFKVNGKNARIFIRHQKFDSIEVHESVTTVVGMMNAQ